MIFDMFPGFSERTTQNAGTLSGGEQQMLVLGRAMMSEPQLLCLDEPSLGLAPIVVQDIFRTIRTINATGTSVLLVEQNARYAFETASRGYVLQTGSVIAQRNLRGSQTKSARSGGLSRPNYGCRRFIGLAMTVTDNYSLAGKSAVVTGAGNGIGRAISLAFARGRSCRRLRRSRCRSRSGNGRGDCEKWRAGSACALRRGQRGRRRNPRRRGFSVNFRPFIFWSMVPLATTQTALCSTSLCRVEPGVCG